MESLCEYQTDEEDEAPVPKSVALTPPPSEEKVLLHLYLVVQGRNLGEFVRHLLGMARLALVNHQVKASFTAHTTFHVSIARPTGIALSQAHIYTSALRSGLSGSKGGRITLEARVIALLSASTRRLYIATPLDEASSRNVVLPLITRTDTIYGQLGLPRYHKDPRPHMSFASTETTAVQDAFHGDMESVGDKFVTEISAVVCEIGRRQLMFALEN